MTGRPARQVVYDAGVLLAADRGDDRFASLHLRYLSSRFTPIVPSPVLTQVWRDGSRQARLARAIRGCLIEPASATLAKKAGVLLGRAGCSDAVDAIVVASAIAHEAVIATGDPDDLRALWEAAETGQAPPLLIF